MKKITGIVLALMLVLCILFAGAYAAYRVYKHFEWNNYLVWEKLESMDSSFNALVNYANNYPINVEHYSFDYSWLEKDEPVLIAHALGGIDGQIYTNSIEAMELAYENGLRVFEADFQIVDGELLLLHDLARGVEMCGLESEDFSSEDFLASSIYGKYTPATWSDILPFLAEHPDAYVITDTKYGKQPHMSYVISALVAETMEYDASLLDRVIVQIYNQQMLDVVMDIHPFKSVIYTLYMSPDSIERVMAFCAKSGVKAVTMHDSGLTEEIISDLDTISVHSLVHTINEPQQAEQFVASGVSGIYTDFITPSDMAG